MNWQPFFVGQKVEFVGEGDYPWARRYGLTVPERNIIYTVREVFEDPISPHDIALRLKEIINFPIPETANHEAGFCIWNMERGGVCEWRPVLSTKSEKKLETAA